METSIVYWGYRVLGFISFFGGVLLLERFDADRVECLGLSFSEFWGLSRLFFLAVATWTPASRIRPQTQPCAPNHGNEQPAIALTWGQVVRLLP